MRNLRRLRRALARERGVSMVEVVVALVLLEIVGASLAGVLTSATAVTKVARHRTLAQQAALNQIESIRAMDYNDVGLVAGNPAGCLGVTTPTTLCPGTSYPPATASITAGGASATLSTQVSYVNDPGPLSYTSYANYKKVVVTITRNSDSTQMAREVTYVAPPVKASESNAVITARVVDYGPNINPQMTNVPVALATGPSAPRNDVTDAAGSIIFAGLTPNPTSGGTAYYDLSVTPPTGYVTLYDTVSPAATAHVQLSPGQTWPTVLYIYKPATIYVDLRNSDGTAFTGTTTTATVSYNRAPGGGASQNFSRALTYPGSVLPVTTMTETTTAYGTQTVQTIPGLSYKVAVLGGNFYFKDAVSLSNYTNGNVPDPGYPSVTTKTFTFTNTALANVTATVKNNATGVACTSATVTITGGPWSGAPWNFSASATTNSSGNVSIPNVPIGSGYVIKATKSGWSTATSTTTTVSAPTTAALPNPLRISGTGTC